MYDTAEMQIYRPTVCFERCLGLALQLGEHSARVGDVGLGHDVRPALHKP